MLSVNTQQPQPCWAQGHSFQGGPSPVLGATVWSWLGATLKGRSSSRASLWAWPSSQGLHFSLCPLVSPLISTDVCLKCIDQWKLWTLNLISESESWRSLPVLTFIIYLFISFIELQLFYKVVIISPIQQSDSAIHIHISILSQILFPYRLSQNIG